ncbi:MAG: inositol monophosphatase [Lachnospiraceae bacterium]|nr:inositol monophosphatase [Lachnospiraceae bacterium]
MENLKTEIEKLMRECGDIMLNARRDPSMVTAKEGHANFVTTYDKAIQEILKKGLLKLLPGSAFVGEEEDIHPRINEGYAFIVDPIDGTTNFIRDYKQSCISVALLEDGAQKMGFVYNPYLDEMFYAVKGGGAYLNGAKIEVSGLPVEEGIVIFGTSPYYRELNRKSFDLAYLYFQRALDIRRSGSSALDLCSIAAGRAEVFFELCLSPWDFAAGSLIVTEAGGIVTTAEGSPLKFDTPSSVMATNGVA